MPPAPASNGCSQQTRPAPKWAAPILPLPKSHNHCAEPLDAGVVQPHFESFKIAPLLERICREYSSTAQEKNLALTLRNCAATVVSDQLLLERILRNLI